MAPHPKQKEILENRSRFNVVKCGRRFGKTQLCEILFAEGIAKGWRMGYFAPTYKDLSEVWTETKRVFYEIIEKKDESLKYLMLSGGAIIDFWSMEEPDSGRGRKYHRAIVDECEKAKKFKEAWDETIRGTLLDYRGDGYLLSTPKFGDTYFKQLSKKVAPGWKSFKFTTYDNPFIDPSEIDEAIAMDPITGACEYLAEDLDGKALNPFAHQFEPEYHVSDVAEFDPVKRLIISVDFNLNPFAVTFHHFWQDAQGVHHHIVDEASIQHGSIPAMIDEIKLRYSSYLPNAILTGDFMGKSGDISQRDNASYYTQLSRGLNLSQRQLQLYPNPKHENSRSDVNWVLYHAKKPGFDFKINPKCEGTIYDFNYVQCDAFGKIEKRNRKQLSQRADYLDTVRYSINLLWRRFIK